MSRIIYKNNYLEKVLIGICGGASVVVMASFVLLFGFDRPMMPKGILYLVQVGLLFVFLSEKVIRVFNAESKRQFWRGNWYDAVLLLVLGVLMLGSEKWFDVEDNLRFLHVAVGAYLVVQVVIKVCRTTVNMAATGNNPTKTLIISFLVLIVCGGGLLMLPKASTGENLSFIDALFTSTSATCVTGLIVKDTGSDFTLMGQTVILTLIQLGGLGIVVFGAILALLLGQALNVRESVAMQDLLSARTLGKIGNIIAFIFLGTVVIEAIGAVSMFGMWNSVPGRVGNIHEQWFCSVFHSISAFCNAGFSLFDDSLISYQRSWGVFVVLCPLIIMGGLGFGVLYNIFNVAVDRLKRFGRKICSRDDERAAGIPKRLHLQSKIVVSVSFILIIAGMLLIMLLEHYAGEGSAKSGGISGAFFQSVTARTAGFNTVDISALSDSSKMVLILLMFVGGSPGSAAGGIKTVTLAVIVISTIAALRKRSEVEMFKRSMRIVVVGRAIAVTLLFLVVLFSAVLALNITEHGSGFTMSDIMFESASALGTVGLSTGITSSLTTAGKVIIILVMLIGRLGPLTLLAALTFNLKPVKYSYPEEAVIVG